MRRCLPRGIERAHDAAAPRIMNTPSTKAAADIAILLPDLRGGGAEQVAVRLAREWVREGYRVVFVLLRARGELLHALGEGVEVVELGVDRLRGALLPLAAWLREAAPAVLLASMWPLTSIAVLSARLAGGPSRVLVSDHTCYSLAYKNRGVMHRCLLRTSIHLTYPRAADRIAVSADVARDVAALGAIRGNSFTVIGNPVAPASPPAEARSPAGRGATTPPTILSVGNLKPVKNQAQLLEAFAAVRAQRVARLVILGEGGLRPRLEALVAALNLQDDVELPGYADDPYPWYAAADLFVLNSSWEGFGNVIVEALAHGLPVVATDCPGGPREILEDGKYGALVPVGDTGALSRAILEGLARPVDTRHQQRRALDFTADRIARQYLALIFPQEASE